jgi:hypothetical protein
VSNFGRITASHVPDLGKERVFTKVYLRGRKLPSLLCTLKTPFRHQDYILHANTPFGPSAMLTRTVLLSFTLTVLA